ncbi:MAG: 50S ribosomal protein L17 [Microgenomates group bacterium GW2011_GWF2_47_9]|nr:MAG: 50S ribosomal protein L17 [Microgenomates group bacterium GW2011_GWF2_47_9]
MKKSIKNRKLNRDTNARKALFKGLVSSLIEHEEIKTTSAKAKAVRGIFEKLITKAGISSIHSRRQIAAFVQDPILVSKLVDQVAPRYKGVKGGYTKLAIIATRRGDNAPIVKLSLTKKTPIEKSVKKADSKVVKKQASKPTEKKSLVPRPNTRVVKPTHSAGVQASKSTIGTKKGDR